MKYTGPNSFNNVALKYKSGKRLQQTKNVNEPIDKNINEDTKLSFFFLNKSEKIPPIINGKVTDNNESNKASNIFFSPRINIQLLFE